MGRIKIGCNDTMDETEKIRNFINFQYVKMKRMASVGSLILLAVNLSFTIYPYIEHRFSNTILGIPNVYIGIPIIFVLVILLIWFGAHVYTVKMEMYRTEAKATITYNPYQVYAFQPFWEMWWRDVYIPQMKTQLVILKELQNKKKGLKDEIDYMENEIRKVENWLDLGYIPKKDFPQHLKKYYITNKEQRL